MDTMVFTQEILGEFVPHPLSEIFDLVRKYYDQCEAFDQIHCTGRTDKGVAVPNNADEACIIAKHAKELRNEILIEVKRKGFNEMDFQKALITHRST
jgi:hypothetical protein